ncbi:MAG: hypothetical protein U9R00_02275 [Patescibacteria group bacterium]|nr:hypothetical protein [Patescibacteria group bacterium]
MKISPPKAPKKSKKSALSRLLGVGKTKEKIHSRTFRVRAKNNDSNSTNIKSNNSNSLGSDSLGSASLKSDSLRSDSEKPVSTETKSNKQLRKRLGISDKNLSVNKLYARLEKEANDDADDEAKKYEQEQNEYKEHDKIVDVKESNKSSRISIKYPKIKQPSAKKTKEIVKKQVIEVDVEKEGSYLSIDGFVNFVPVHHDPKSYDWSSEEGYIENIKKSKTSANTKKGIKKKTPVKKKVLVTKKAVKKSNKKQATKKKRAIVKKKKVPVNTERSITKKVAKKKVAKKKLVKKKAVKKKVAKKKVSSKKVTSKKTRTSKKKR